MDYHEIIKQLGELEAYYEEGRKKVYNIRMQIEGTGASAPLGKHENEESKLANLLGKKTNEKSLSKKDKNDDEESSSAE